MTSIATPWAVCETPIGRLTLIGGPSGLRGLYFPGHCDELAPSDRDHHLLATPLAQLREYFAGERRNFDLELDLAGTPFQHDVWEQLCAIAPGTTSSYAALARAIGRPRSVRAVGAAVGRTPLPVIIPCHRAVGSDGRLVKYLGGLERKRALLELEGALGGRGPWARRRRGSVAGSHPVPEADGLSPRTLERTSSPTR